MVGFYQEHPDDIEDSPFNEWDLDQGMDEPEPEFPDIGATIQESIGGQSGLMGDPNLPF